MEIKILLLPRLLLLLACFLGSGAAAAETPTPHWYLSFNLGENDVDQSGFKDADSTAVYVGYQFEPHVGLELGYVDHGESDFRDFADTYVAVDGYEISLVLSAPLGESLVLFGKIGSYAWEAEGVVAGDTVAEDDDHSIVYGAGLAMPFGDMFSVRLSALAYDDVSDGDITSVTLGINLAF